MKRKAHPLGALFPHCAGHFVRCQAANGKRRRLTYASLRTVFVAHHRAF
jgi:hypothetical protein